MKKRASRLNHAILCFLFSGAFLFFGFCYQLVLVKRYREDDFRGGGAMDLALIIGLVYGGRAIWSLFAWRNIAEELAKTRNQPK